MLARAALPGTGTILAAVSGARFDGERYDRDLAPCVATTLC